MLAQMAAPSQAEQLLFGSVFLFAAPLLFFVWGLWLLMGPISHLRFIFPNLSANETTLYNSIFFVEIRIGAIITMTLATVFWLALRRANNRVTFTCLIATALACIISAAMYIHFLQPTAHHQQPAPATLGTVLSLIIWIGYALLAFLACMRLYLNKSLHRGLSKATGLTLFVSPGLFFVSAFDSLTWSFILKLRDSIRLSTSVVHLGIRAVEARPPLHIRREALPGSQVPWGWLGLLKRAHGDHGAPGRRIRHGAGRLHLFGIEWGGHAHQRSDIGRHGAGRGSEPHCVQRGVRTGAGERARNDRPTRILLLRRDPPRGLLPVLRHFLLREFPAGASLRACPILPEGHCFRVCCIGMMHAQPHGKALRISPTRLVGPISS